MIGFAWGAMGERLHFQIKKVWLLVGGFKSSPQLITACAGSRRFYLSLDRECGKCGVLRVSNTWHSLFLLERRFSEDVLNCDGMARDPSRFSYLWKEVKVDLLLTEHIWSGRMPNSPICTSLKWGGVDGTHDANSNSHAKIKKLMPTKRSFWGNRSYSIASIQFS